MVVWVVILLSLLAVGLGSRQVFALTLTQRMEHDWQASYVAQAALQRLVTVLSTDVTPKADGFSDLWADDQAQFAKAPFGAGSWTISVADEERNINLNTASAEVLARLFEQVGLMREDEARAAADAVLDWRDEDKDTHEDGAEDFYYLGLERSYECQDGLFENREELRLIRGITPEAARALEPYVTVAGLGAVNINTAPVEVLQALGLSEEGVNGVVFYRAGEDNVEGTPDDRMIGAVTAIAAELGTWLPKEDLPRLQELLGEGVFTVMSEAFTFSIQATVEGAAHPLHVEGAVDRAGRLLYWSEA